MTPTTFKAPIQQQDCQNVTIIRATTGGYLPEAGIKTGETIYLAWDWSVRRLFVVQWERIQWVCSCGKARCIHRLATNTALFEEIQKRKA